MRAAVFCTCPQGVYSGGRYHAFMLAICLARLGYDTYFVTNEQPVFADELTHLYPEGKLTVVKTKDFLARPVRSFSLVALAPQVSPLRLFYERTIEFARRSGARLALINFESANWYNSLSPVPKPEENWAEWKLLPAEGCLVLCSAQESLRYATKYYRTAAPDTRFDVWQPAINDLAIPPEPAARSRSIVVFVRPTDKHKGGADVASLLRPELAGYSLDLVIGNPKQVTEYIRELSARAAEVGMEVRGHFGLSDVDKFALIRSASALVFPSYFEGYGYPPIEALACNTPCVAYDIPVVRENCGDLAILVPPGDTEALARETIAAVASLGKRARTADHPQVQFLSSIAARTEALRAVLEADRRECRRLAKRLVHNPAATQVRATAATRLDLNGMPLVYFQVEVPGRIILGSASHERFDRVVVQRGRQGTHGMRHKVFAFPSGGTDAAEEAMSADICLTYEGGASILLALSDLEASAPSPAFPPYAVEVTKAVRERNEVIVSGWVYPEVPYDELYFVGGPGEAYLAQVGLPNSDYSKSYPKSQGLRCGFCVTLPDEAVGSAFHVLLAFGGKLVGQARLGALPDPKPSGDMVLLPINDDTPISFGQDAAPKAKAIFLSSATRNDGLVNIRGWSNVYSELAAVEIFEHASPDAIEDRRLIARVPLHVHRTDIEKKFDVVLEESIGFDVVTCNRSGVDSLYTLELVSPAGRLDQLASIRPDTAPFQVPPRRASMDPISYGHLKAANPQVARASGKGAASGARKPAWACSPCQYDLKTNTLFIRGWVLTDDPFRVEVWLAGQQAMLGLAKTGLPRADVARRFGKEDDAAFGYEFEQVVPLQKLGEITLRVMLPEGPVHRFVVHSPKLVHLEAFQVTDWEYDPNWRKLWMRGLFAHSGLRPASISVTSGDMHLATGVAPTKRQRGTEPYAGWVVEAVLEQDLEEHQDIAITVQTTKGLSATLTTSLARLRQSLRDNTAPRGDTLAYARERDGAVARMLQRFDPGRPTVLIVVHNLDAPDRPEKLEALIGLDRALRERGAQLLCLHHAKGSVADAIGEIHFFDPVLNDFYQAGIAAPWGSGLTRDRATEDFLSYVVRMAYGFYASRDRRPVSWADCSRQVEEEYRKLKVVIETLKPQSVLLWHQWNSLSELARMISAAQGIPYAFIHEGMLPRTMTIDEKGMMAEASCVGALLRGSSEADQTALAQARALIRHVADERLDRKPQLAMATGKAISAKLRAQGRKVVFYAGVNDWQSGNLPLDNPLAKQHAPHLADTVEGLTAVAKAAQELDAYVIFKPHPNLYPRDVECGFSNVILLRDANTIDLILDTDVTVTLLSSVAYISLAHRKPTLLLGRNTLSGAGAAYELTEAGDLRQLLAEALEAVDLDKRLSCYELHVAALLKHYFFPYGKNSKFMINTYDDAVDYILSLGTENVVRLNGQLGSSAAPAPMTEDMPRAKAVQAGGRQPVVGT